jgi:1,2-dihydroxy-3-keto-5-methylthiopentene dioxygenase
MMALVRIPAQAHTIEETDAIRHYLSAHGIDYEQVGLPSGSAESTAGLSADALLASYADKIGELKARGGYTTADVIDVTPETPGLDAMLTRFNSEHWHDEDEVRLIVEGRGLFHIHPVDGPVFAIEVYPGDLIRVPKGTHHWFDLCSDRRIRAIRLFQNPSGWSPQYTHTGVDRDFQPVCFGPAYIAPRVSVPPIASA